MVEFLKSNQTPITHIHVPEPGVSNARNGALAAAKGRYILFIDDDYMPICSHYSAVSVTIQRA